MKSPAVDAHIAKSAEFARPILTRLRALMHKACPRIEETIKWGVPHFEYQGVVANMAAFKQHASFGFWKQKLMNDPAGFFPKADDSSMGGRKIHAMADLPADAVLIRYIKAAVALKNNAKARATYEAFPPSKQREYVEWLTEAKQEATRQKRLATAIEWMAAGKSRHWKYQNC